MYDMMSDEEIETFEEGQPVRITAIARGDDRSWVGKEGTLTRLDAGDRELPFLVRFRPDAAEFDTEFWVRGVEHIAATESTNNAEEARMTRTTTTLNPHGITTNDHVTYSGDRADWQGQAGSVRSLGAEYAQVVADANGETFRVALRNLRLTNPDTPTVTATEGPKVGDRVRVTACVSPRSAVGQEGVIVEPESEYDRTQWAYMVRLDNTIESFRNPLGVSDVEVISTPEVAPLAVGDTVRIVDASVTSAPSRTNGQTGRITTVEMHRRPEQGGIFRVAIEGETHEWLYAGNSIERVTVAEDAATFNVGDKVRLTTNEEQIREIGLFVARAGTTATVVEKVERRGRPALRVMFDADDASGRNWAYESMFTKVDAASPRLTVDTATLDKRVIIAASDEELADCYLNGSSYTGRTGVIIETGLSRTGRNDRAEPAVQVRLDGREGSGGMWIYPRMLAAETAVEETVTDLPPSEWQVGDRVKFRDISRTRVDLRGLDATITAVNSVRSFDVECETGPTNARGRVWRSVAAEQLEFVSRPGATVAAKEEAKPGDEWVVLPGDIRVGDLVRVTADMATLGEYFGEYGTHYQSTGRIARVIGDEGRTKRIVLRPKDDLPESGAERTAGYKNEFLEKVGKPGDGDVKVGDMVMVTRIEETDRESRETWIGGPFRVEEVGYSGWGGTRYVGRVKNIETDATWWVMEWTKVTAPDFPSVNGRTAEEILAEFEEFKRTVVAKAREAAQANSMCGVVDNVMLGELDLIHYYPTKRKVTITVTLEGKDADEFYAAKDGGRVTDRTRATNFLNAADERKLRTVIKEVKEEEVKFGSIAYGGRD